MLRKLVSELVVLCLETSHGLCSVYLKTPNQEFSRSSEINFDHGKNLAVFIQEVLEEAQLKAIDIDVVAYNCGPGSYTGLRIGASVAKGICFAAGCKLVAVSGLKCMADTIRNREQKSTHYLSAIYARNRRVYAAVYNQKGSEALSKGVFTYEELLSSLSKMNINPIWTINDTIIQKEISSLHESNVVLLTTSAKNVFYSSLENIENQVFENIAFHEPEYITGFGKVFVNK